MINNEKLIKDVTRYLESRKLGEGEKVKPEVILKAKHHLSKVFDEFVNSRIEAVFDVPTCDRVADYLLNLGVEPATLDDANKYAIELFLRYVLDNPSLENVNMLCCIIKSFTKQGGL